MPKKPTIQDVLQAVKALPTQADFTIATTKVADLAEAVQGLASHMDERFDAVQERFNEQDAKFATKDDLLKFATKEDLRAFATKDDLASLESRVLSHIDGFVTLHNTLDVELASLRSKTNRHDTFLHKVAKKLDLEFEPT